MDTTATIRNLWGELGVPVRRYVGSRVRDSHAADDITQDVMLKVQTHLDALPPEDRLVPWALGIARNAIVDHYRSRRAHADVAAVEPADGDPDEHARITGEMAGCLRRMVEHLPEPYRQALRLADLDGVSQQEVADRADISLSGAKSRVQRARQMLKALILDCCRVEVGVAGGVVDYETTERTARYCGESKAQVRCGG